MTQSSSNPFTGAVQNLARAHGSSTAFGDALQVLEDFCAAVSDYPGGNLECRKEPGFVTNLGQEYRIVVQSKSRNLDHLLLRAHVAPTVFKVMLDLYDEDLKECDSPQDMQRELTRFLEKDATVDVLKTLAAN